MTTQLEEASYEAAKQRAIDRVVGSPEFRDESDNAFVTGLLCMHEDKVPEADLGRAMGRAISNILGRAISNILPETNFGFAFICGVLCHIEAKKGKGYLASWQRRGMKDGGLANLQRKFDRVEALVNYPSEDADKESLTETLADLAVYALKMITLQNVLNSEEVRKWVEKAQSL